MVATKSIIKMTEPNSRSDSHNSKCSSKTILLIICGAISGLIVGCVATWLWHYYASPIPHHTPKKRKGKPNIIIFLADDVGYGDFQAFGNPNQEWTAVDRMAKEGKKFTQFYSPVSVCSPSRAAILTGRYPVRTGIFGHSQVFKEPTSSGGLPRREVTIAEALKENGYRTGMAGKWHLGINKYNDTDGFYLPIHQGFDEVKTILPYSIHWLCQQDKSFLPGMSEHCFLYKNKKIIEQPINLGSLTSQILKDTIDFISEYQDDQFFFMLSFSQAHVPLFADRRFAGNSRRGPFGDSLNEMGWAIGEVLDHLAKLGIDSNTFTLFLPDQGALQDGCGESGSIGPFRGGKLSTWEGGVRIPVVARWPGVIEADSVGHGILSTMDIFPTVLGLAGVNVTNDFGNVTIDGNSFQNELISGEETSSQSLDRPIFFYCSNLLTAARFGNYKVHYYANTHPDKPLVREHELGCNIDSPSQWQKMAANFTCEHNFIKQDPPLLFDVELDSREYIFMDPESERYQEIVTQISRLVRDHETSIDVVESELDKPNIPELQPCCNPPTCTCMQLRRIRFNLKTHERKRIE